MSVIGAIGLLSSVLGIFDFTKSNLPSNSSPNGAAIRVKVGNGDQSLNFGGSILKLQGYDSENMLIGTAEGSYVSNGDIKDYVLDQQSGGIQTEYLTVIGTDDAICISWISIKNLDGGFDAAWTGDIAAQCQHSWHWGNQVAGKLRETGEDYKPRCAWLDADHTNDLSTGALKIYFPAYGKSVQDTINQGTTCSTTKFTYDAAPIDDVPSRKRSEPRRSMIGAPRPEWSINRLIISNAPEHNATELCMDKMSWGPDAVGSEGYYCNMETRKLIPLCEKEDVDGCVHVDATKGKITKRANVAKRATELHLKSYKDVQVW